MGDVVQGSFGPKAPTRDDIAGNMRESLTGTLRERGVDQKTATRNATLIADSVMLWVVKFDAMCAAAVIEAPASEARIKSIRDCGIVSIVAAATSACVVMALSERLK